MSTFALRQIERHKLRKRSSSAVADALLNPPALFARHKRQLTALGRRIERCVLAHYVQTYRDHLGRLVPIASNKRACHSRLCEQCEACRTKALLRLVRAEIRYIHQTYPDVRALFLTTTERSAAQGTLARVLPAHITAVKTLFALPRVASTILGHYSAVEIAPRSDDAGVPTFGVHSHHLVMVPPSYWTRDYIHQTDWVALFRRARHLNYNPVTDVRIAQATGVDDPVAASEAAARDLIKYFVKPSAFVHHHDGTATVDAALIAELALALKHKHLHRRGGCFLKSRKVIRALDLALDDEPTSTPPPEPAQRLHYSRD
ncbi:MAG: protein rep [Hyphomicrobiaceae bacterium]